MGSEAFVRRKSKARKIRRKVRPQARDTAVLSNLSCAAVPNSQSIENGSQTGITHFGEAKSHGQGAEKNPLPQTTLKQLEVPLIETIVKCLHKTLRI